MDKINFQLLPMTDTTRVSYKQVRIGVYFGDGNLGINGNLTIEEAEKVKKQLEEEIKSAKAVREEIKRSDD